MEPMRPLNIHLRGLILGGGGEGRGGEGMEFFIFFLFPSYSHGNLDFLVSEKINIFQVPQGSQKYRSML
jgi:hypothetical protein